MWLVLNTWDVSYSYVIKVILAEHLGTFILEFLRMWLCECQWIKSIYLELLKININLLFQKVLLQYFPSGDTASNTSYTIFQVCYDMMLSFVLVLCLVSDVTIKEGH